MKLWKVKVTKCRSNIEGTCCISRREVEQIFDDFNDAIAFTYSKKDMWTTKINPHVWEYEVSSCRELKQVERAREELVCHVERTWE